MAQNHNPRSVVPPGSPHSSAPSAKPGRLQAWLPVALTTLCVARPLLPSEAVSWLGDGQPYNMLWLCLGVLVGLAGLKTAAVPLRWRTTDFAVAAFYLCYAASALWAFNHAAPRPSINMLWEGTAVVWLYFLVRQLAAAPAARRALVAILISLGVVLACYGLEQYFVSMPAARAEYARNHRMALPGGGHLSPGSVEQQHYENRLNSSEPMATFALTNSLAGYLVTWLVVAGGCGATLLASAARPRLRQAVACLAAIVLMAICLLLTKSRSAYLAGLAGLAVLPLMGATVPARLRWRLMVGGAAVLLGVVGVAIAVRGLDVALVSEAGKSLGYRLEYWRSTWAMIADYPWLGCGPGNFQDTYTAYKLPQASEEVQDPHNMFLEIWSVAGTPAFLALLAMVVTAIWQSPGQEPGTATGSAAPHDSSPHSHTPGHSSHKLPARLPGFTGWHWWLGAALGPALSYALGPLVGLDFDAWHVLAAWLVGGCVLWGLWPWVERGQLPPRLTCLGLVVLTVHLTFSGGIEYPGVAYSWWILLALTVGGGGSPAAAKVDRPVRSMNWRAATVALVSMMLALACSVTAYRPVLGWTAAVSRAEAASDRYDAAAYRLAVVAAVKFDPWSAGTWQLLAELELDRLNHETWPSPAQEKFEEALERTLALQPRSSKLRLQAAQWMLDRYDKTHEPEDVRRAVAYSRQAVERYPASAAMHAEYALTLWTAGDRAEARAEAAVARRLDEIMPHADKKLINLKQRRATDSGDSLSAMLQTIE